MNSHFKTLMSVAVALTVTACATTSTQIYYWGNYSDTAYQLKKEPSDKTREAHKASLQNILDVATSKNKRVPPGIYAELALIEMESGQSAQALQLLQQEKLLFPESAQLVDTLTKNIAKVN